MTDAELLKRMEAIVRAATTFVETYQNATGHPFDGFMFDRLKQAVLGLKE